MTSITNHRHRAGGTGGSLSGPLLGAMGLMALVHFSTAGGQGFTTHMGAVYASAFIVLYGTPAVYAFMRRQHDGDVWGLPNREQRNKIRRVTFGNVIINLGLPLAATLIGIGAGNAILAAGPAFVGLREDLKQKRLGFIVGRIVMVGFLVCATEPWQGLPDTDKFQLFGFQVQAVEWAGIPVLTLIGCIAALGPAWHFWNLAHCLPSFDGDKAKDQAMLRSNVYSLPIIVGVAVAVGLISREGPGWGPTLLGLGAGVFVFAIPVILTNRANKHLTKAQQGSLFALSPAFGGAVGWLGDKLGLIEQRPITAVGWLGIVGVMVTAIALTVFKDRAEQNARQAAAATSPEGGMVPTVETATATPPGGGAVPTVEEEGDYPWALSPDKTATATPPGGGAVPTVEEEGDYPWALSPDKTPAPTPPEGEEVPTVMTAAPTPPEGEEVPTVETAAALRELFEAAYANLVVDEARIEARRAKVGVLAFRMAEAEEARRTADAAEARLEAAREYQREVRQEWGNTRS